MTLYDHGLDKSTANFVALSPTSFVERSAEVFGDLESVVHGKRRYSWRQTRERAARLGVVKLDDSWATRTLWVGVKAGSVLTTDIAKLFDFMSAR